MKNKIIASQNTKHKFNISLIEETISQFSGLSKIYEEIMIIITAN